MTNNNTSLYQLIKEQKEKKGRPLKIICDWDETLQPFNSFVLYETTKEDEERDFNTYFQSFYENEEVEMEYSDELPFAKYKGNFRNQRLRQLQGETNGVEKIRQEFKKHRTKNDFYEKSPFLSLARSL